MDQEYKTTPGKANICPYCNQSTKILKIEDKKLTIKLCCGCHAVWEIYETFCVRLYGIKPENIELHEEYLICPICSSMLEANYSNHTFKCSDPICSYIRRLPGLSINERAIKKEYSSLRQNIFKRVDSAEKVPDEDFAKLKQLQAQVKALERFTLEEEKD